MEDEEFNELYQDILNNGIKDESYREKLEKLVQGICKNMYDLSEYAEIDVTEWGNLIY